MAVKVVNGPGLINRALTSVRKSSPELLVVAGTLSFFATLFAMHKTTLKTKDIVDGVNEELELINNTKEIHEVNGEELIEYTDEDRAEDIRIVKKHAAGKVIKAALPTVLLAAATISCFWGADYIRKQRHAALFAAAEMTLKSYNSYRNGVIEKYGKEVDNELKYKLFNDTVDIEEYNEESGKTKKVKKKIKRTNYDGYSDFARMFDENNDLFQKNVNVNGKEPSYGVYNLKQVTDLEREANEKLRKNGFLTINEVYDMLHFEKTIAGRDAGWIWDINDPTCVEGSHISFGILGNKSEEDIRAILIGIDSSFILDFNIDTLDVWAKFDDTPLTGLLPGRSK